MVTKVKHNKLLQNYREKNSCIMISRKFGDKNETQQAYARMLTNLPNGLVTHAKLQRKKSWIMISRECGDKNEAPHVSTKLYSKNS